MREAIAAFTEYTGDHTEQLGDPVNVAIGLEFLGSIHEDQGQYAAALEKYQQALELFRQYAEPAICG